MSFEKHPLHLKDSEIQKSEEVVSAVEKQERLEGEPVPNDPTPRIDAYMDRLENIFLNPDERVRERNIDLLRDKIYDNLLIKRDKFPESYFELQQRIARERGQVVEEIPENIREQMISTAIEDQRHSLDNWINYLTSDDAMYPTWFKYYVWKNITKLSQFDKERGEFKTRTETTVAPFPDIYREPLAQIADLYSSIPQLQKEIEPKIQALRSRRNSLRQQARSLTPDDTNKSGELLTEIGVIDEEIKTLSAPIESFNKKFPTLYAELIQKTLEQQIEGNEEIKGEWVKYVQGDMAGAERLYQSLENKGTGWCTAGRSTAEQQVESGDFYVYYTYNKDNEPTQPRIAIRMQGDQIGEVRGILPHQNLEPIMEPVLDEKLKDFGSEADSYKKKSGDMKHLTAIWKKQFETNTPFTKEDLVFLYEVDSTIESFGYDRDERIESLLRRRNQEEDMLTIFECSKEEIAHSIDEVTEQTKVYLGQWDIHIYNKIKKFPNIKHLYESFPGKKIFTFELHTSPEIDSKRSAITVLGSNGIYTSHYAEDLLDKTEFSHEGKIYNLVQFTVGQLGFPRGATTEEIYAKAEELGLELCPAEVGPQLRLQYLGKDWKLIAMKQITGRDGVPDVFSLVSGDAGLRLDGDDARPAFGWHGINKFVFLSRKDS